MSGRDGLPLSERADPRRLGEILLEMGVLDAAALERALLAAGPGERLASRAAALGLAEERDLAFALARQLGHPALCLSTSLVELAALSLVPRVIAERERVLPVAVDRETLTLAAADVRGREIFDQVAFACGRRVVPLVAVDGILAAAIEAAYDAAERGERVLTGRLVPAGVGARPALDVLRPATVDLPEDEALLPLLEPLPRDDEPPLAPRTAGSLVLVVDDEDAVRALLVRVLVHDGYEVIEARTGREALEQLRRARPQVVLLDAMLPEVHGFEICTAIKQNPAFEGTSVVMISAVYKGWQHAREIQEVHGADAFVEKPFDVHYVRKLTAHLAGRALPKNLLPADWVKKVQRLRDEARVHLEMGDLDEAEACLKQWRALDPFDAHAYLLLGNARIKRGDLDGAMQAYERAATFGPELYAAFKNLALVYERLGFLSRSRQSWYRAAELAKSPAAREEILERLKQRFPGM